MAYDRYDERGGDRSRWRDDRSERGPGGEQGGRGFFERARDEVTSWFGDDDSDQRRHGDDRSAGRDNSNWRSAGNRDAERGRDQGDEQRRYGSSAQDRYGYSGRDDDRSYGSGDYGRTDPGRSSYAGGSERGGQDRDRSYPGTLGQSIHSDRDHGRTVGRYDRDENRYSAPARDDGRGEEGRGGYRSGMGSQDFARSQYGRQDFSQDQDRDRGGRTYNYGGWGDRDSQRQAQSYGGRGGDDHYSQWRQRQMEELDRDYDDYRREHQSRFENEFSGWRQRKQTKRQMLGAIREHMEVVDEAGEHIGAVDKVRGDRIIMTRNDPAAGGVHRSFSCALLERVDDKIYLSGSAATIRHQLHEEGDNDRGRDDRGSRGGILGGLFGGGRSDDRAEERPTTSTNRPEGAGPHVLDRSFSGTYDDEKK